MPYQQLGTPGSSTTASHLQTLRHSYTGYELFSHRLHVCGQSWQQTVRHEARLSAAAEAQYKVPECSELLELLVSSLATGGRAHREAPMLASSPPPGLVGHASTATASAAAAVMAAAAAAAAAAATVVVSSAETVSQAVLVGRLATAGVAKAAWLRQRGMLL